MGIKPNLNAVAGTLAVIGWISGALLAGTRGASALSAAFGWGLAVAVAIFLAYVLTRRLIHSRTRDAAQAPPSPDLIERAEGARREIRRRLQNINVPQGHDIQRKRDDLRLQAREVVAALHRIDDLTTGDFATTEKKTKAIKAGVDKLEEVAEELRDPGNLRVEALEVHAEDLAAVHQYLLGTAELTRNDES